MEETGLVEEISGSNAKVSFKRTSACGQCKACLPAGQAGLPAAQTKMIVEASNPLGAKVGDTVKVEVSSRRGVQAALLLYGIPIIAFLGGGLAGDWLAGRLDFKRNSEIVAFGVGLLFLAVYYFFIRRYGKGRDEKFKPKIIEVV